MGDHFGVTVIIRTKNVEDILSQTLKALFSQTFREFHLLVVDSGSTDKTVEIIKRYPCELISIKAEDYIPGRVLNAAIARTSSSLIVFLNSDAVLLTPESLSHLIRAFDDSSVQAAFGRQLARPDAEPWVRRDYEASFPEIGKAPSWMYLSLPIAAMRRSIWEKRPFYESAWGSEDTEWGHWAKGEGFHIQYVPSALVVHSHNYTFRQLYGRRFIEGEADAFIFRQTYSFPNMLWDLSKAKIRDFLYYMKLCHPLAFFKTPFLRFVYYWAYYKGHHWGMSRLKSGNHDIITGQKTVLAHYSDKEKPNHS